MSAGNGHPVYDRTELEVLKRAVDLAALIQEHGVPLRRVGKGLLGRCPFHEDSEESFSIHADADPPMWKCFGCGQGGDALSFLRLKQDWSFREAVECLRAQAAGALDETRLLELRERVAQPKPPPEPESDRLPGGHARPDLLKRVADFYARRLPGANDARAYLSARGLGANELLESFAIGWCDGTSLLKTIPDRGELRDAMTRIGILNEHGREHFAGCIVVPLTHPDEGVVGLYGRKIAPNARVKHLYLRGSMRGVLNWQAMQSSREIFIAESVLDALSVWWAGDRNVTCVFGANVLHPDLLELLGRFAVSEVRFCLDADRAGRAATARLAGQIGERGIHCFQVELPRGKDPNQVLTEQGREVLHDLVSRLTMVVAAESEETAPLVEASAKGLRLHFGELTYEVQMMSPSGGDRKVRLRTAWRGRNFTDKLDLNSHRARLMTAGHICAHFSLPRAEVERQLLVILEETERWAETLQEAPSEEAQPTPMTAAEREEALEFLRRPDLADAILTDIETLGWVGEEQPKLLAYLIGISRRLERPLAGVIISESGAGKSSLAEMVEVLTPPEEVVAYTRISSQALMYEEKDFLKRKLLILEERVGAEQADYSIRVLQSKQKLAQASVTKDPQSGRMYTKHYEVEGPIAYIETTTNPRINHENATRCFEIVLDESEAQTRRIQDAQRLARTPRGLLRRSRGDGIRRRHHNAQRLLQTVAVVIPYVDRLSFPSRWLRTRRDNERFLCLIEAVTFLHQHSRPRQAEEHEGGQLQFIEATAADYRLAYGLARKVLGITLHDLSRNAQDLLERTREMVAEMQQRNEVVHFTRRELRDYTGWQDHRLRDALQELGDMEYLQVLKGSQGQTFQYRLAGGGGGDALPLRELTTPDQLEAMLGT